MAAYGKRFRGQLVSSFQPPCGRDMFAFVTTKFREPRWLVARRGDADSAASPAH